MFIIIDDEYQLLTCTNKSKLIWIFNFYNIFYEIFSPINKFAVNEIKCFANCYFHSNESRLTQGQSSVIIYHCTGLVKGTLSATINIITIYMYDHKAKQPITLILWTKLAKALTVPFFILLISKQQATNFVYLSVNSNNNRIPRAQIFTIFFKYTAFAQNFYKKNCSCENAMDYESILEN